MSHIPKWIPHFHWMRQNGADAGAAEMNVDGSVTPVTFYYECTRRAEVYRMLVYIEDNAAMRVQDFGAISGGLTNGIGVSTTLDGVTYDALDGYPIKTNGEWAAFCYDAGFLDQGSGNNVFKARWTACPAIGVVDSSGKLGGSMPVILQAGDRVTFTVSDDLTSLVGFRVQIQLREMQY